MKKKIVTAAIVSAVLALALAGCAGSSASSASASASGASSASAESSASSASASASGASSASASASAQAESGGSVGLANPWSEVKTAEEAAQGAGLDNFNAGAEAELDLGGEPVVTYRYMEGLAEAQIEYPASMLTVRKGVHVEDGDVSGDYNEYSLTWSQTVGDVVVKCQGNRTGESQKSTWTVGDVDYSISALGLGGDVDFGLNEERLALIVAAIS